MWHYSPDVMDALVELIIALVGQHVVILARSYGLILDSSLFYLILLSCRLLQVENILILAWTCL